MATPSTHFGFTCAPTPASSSGGPSYQLSDITRTLPVPTLGPGQTPPERPVALEVVHHPDGTCRVWLDLEQSDPTFKSRRERIDHECLDAKLSPTVYPVTVTQRIPVGCDGCQYIRGGDMTTACPRSLSSVPPGSLTVSAQTATTK